MPKLTFPSSAAINIRHPFQFLFIQKKENPDDEKESYYLAVVYYSSVYQGLNLKEKSAEYESPIKITGLNFFKKVDNFPEKKIYCVLELPIKNMRIDTDGEGAQIKWVEGEDDPEKLAPVEFEDPENLRQVKARIIIGVLISDANEVPQAPDTEKNEQPTEYIVQYVNTNLLMVNMLIQGVPVIYPVPFGGGPIFSDFQ